MPDRRHSRRHRVTTRLVATAGILLLVVGITGLVSPPKVVAQAAPVGLSSYTVSARADAATVGIVDHHAPLVVNGQLIDATPATAQSLVDSLGQSQGFASAPYAGDFITNVPSLVNGLFNGKAPPLPSYPFIVNSSYPGTPSSGQIQGPYGITSNSVAKKTTASARLGVVTGNLAAASITAVSTAEREPGTATLIGTADTDIVGLSLGPLLKIGDISAHAKLTAALGQTPVKETSFSVGTVTVAGIDLGITDKGLQLGSTTVPLVSVSSLTNLLAVAGITLSYLPPTQTVTSIRSAGLSVSFIQNVPTQGPVAVTLVLGQVSVTAESVAATAGPPDSGGPSSNAQLPVAASDVTTAGGQPVGTETSAISQPVTMPPSSLPAPRVARPSVPSRSSAMGPLLPVLGPKATGLYLALVGAGVLVLAAARALGKLGGGLPVADQPPTGAGNGPVLRLPRL